MTFWTLIRRSLRFHARAHLGVVSGSAIGSAALIGALIVGDSVRGTLRQRALAGLGRTWYALNSGDRPFDADLRLRLNPGSRLHLEPRFSAGWYSPSTARLASILPGSGDPLSEALVLPGVASTADGSARANRVQVIGVDRFWPSFAGWGDQGYPSGPGTGLSERWARGESALINETLARQLAVKVGNEIVLRIRKPSALALDAALSPRDEDAIALRLVVEAIVPSEKLGDFTLATGPAPPANLFVPLEALGEKTALKGRANVSLFGELTGRRHWGWGDTQRQKLASWLEARAPQIPLPTALSSLPRATMRITRPDSHSLAARLAQLVKPRTEQPVPEEVSQAWLTAQLRQHWDLDDAGLEVRTIEQPESKTGGQYIEPWIEVASSRVFLDPPVVAAALRPRTLLLTNHFGLAQDNQSDLAAASFVTNGVRVLTYLANLIRAGDRATPYSMVTAAEGPYVRVDPENDEGAGPAWLSTELKTPSADLRDDEILVNQWLADDLKVKPGDAVDLNYFVPDSGSRLTERTNSFRVRAIVPLKGIWADRTLMPEFPGVAKAESTRDWDTGFPLTYRIREQDEAYWKQYRGTPKAFITLAAGQKMWANRFGSLTAVRYEVPSNSFSSTWREIVARNLLANLDPGDLGLRVEPVRRRALDAAEQSQDFGQLFLGFSFFLVVAALLLMELLFQFGLEQRACEVGTLLALGFTPRQVRRLLLGEGAALALAGGCLGVLGGLAYAKAMLWALATLWRAAVGSAPLEFFVTGQTVLIGLGASVAVCVLTLWLALRKQARQPIVRLFAGGAGGAPPGAGRRGGRRPWSMWLGAVAGSAALGLGGWALASGGRAEAGTFFGAGSLCLLAGLAFCAAWLRRLDRAGTPASKAGPARSAATPRLALGALSIRGCSRRLSRSLATVALLACGAFLVTSIGVFRLDAIKDAADRRSGTGGFALLGQSTLPVTQELDTAAGRDALGLDASLFTNVNVVQFRVHEGDEASCLNLNRAQRPRLLAARPEALAGRFSINDAAPSYDARQAWELLKRGSDAATSTTSTKSIAPTAAAPIPAIGDANAIEWGLGKSLGDTLDYTDESGRPFKVKLVGAVENSILQGGLIIDEAEFVKRFPGESGYRMFLIDAPVPAAARVSAALSRALQDAGLEVASATARLNAFNAVQNTYLDTFQILGGLGLLLGSAGLGVVVLRNVLERRSELGLLTAVGFRPGALQRLVLGEHALLLGLGLGVGVLSAAVAVLPALVSSGIQTPWRSLVPTLAAVVLNGLVWTWLATRFALRGDLLAALRNE